jgi:predicted LPLAT superfamily acyltransferase
VQLLLDRGADIEAKNEKEETVLQIAAWHGHKEVVQILLDRRANFKAEDQRKGTTLHIAA